MLGGEDSENTVLGNFIHNYAELRICFPQDAKEKGIDYYVDVIVNRCAGLDNPEAREVTRTSIRNALINLDKLIENEEFDQVKKNYIPREKNRVNELFPEDFKDKKSDISEVKYDSSSYRMTGVFDAIIGGCIYDFKTGKIKSGTNIMNEMDRRKIHEYGLEFQPMFYISLIEEVVPDGEKVFTLFYTKDNYNKSMTGEDIDINENKRNVYLISSKEWYLDNLYFDNHVPAKSPFRKYQQEIIADIKEIGIDNLDESFVNHLVSRYGPFNSTEQKAVNPFVNKLLKNLVGMEMFCNEKNVYITRKGVEDFRKQVTFDYNKIKEFYATQFPINQNAKCSKCEFNKSCIRKEVDVDE